MAKKTPSLTTKQQEELLLILQNRFEKNTKRHPSIKWNKVLECLQSNPNVLWSINQMEQTGGEPDVVDVDDKSGSITFMDCSAESPKGRRSICYDPAALESRKEFKPAHSAIGMAADMGIEILNEDQYRFLQQLGVFDAKTSSWILTPPSIRKLGGAVFADYRYATVFVYHNGAESYYAARGFRGFIKV